MSGFLDLIGKIGNWILPNKEEYRRNKIDSLKKEQNELIKRPATPANVRRLDDIAGELAKLYDAAKNSN